MEDKSKIIDKRLKKEYVSCFKIIEEKLIDYYTFCVYTLHKVLKEEEKYKSLALDAFERFFSLYFFHKETELLYEKVEELEKKQKWKKDIFSKVYIIHYIFKSLSYKGLRAIYYSPGVYHRVRLAKYIFETKLDMEQLESFSINKNIYLRNVPENDSVILEISHINQDYIDAEREYIYKWISNKKKLTISDIAAKYKLNDENACCKEYKDFYNTIFYKIKEALEEKFLKGKVNKFRKQDAKSIAKTMVEQMPIEKRLLHFWVILYSFLSEDSLIEMDRFE